MTDVTLPHVKSETPTPDLRHPSLYLNRELSWLEFNRRVLHEARDPRTPLLERLKFLGIFASNLDEFFQVRVAGLKQQLAARYTDRTADGMTAEEQLRAIAAVVRDQVGEHSTCLLEEVLPALRREGVDLITAEEALSGEDREFLAEHFRENVYPVLTPLAVDPAHPFPYISNLSLSLAVVLRDDMGEEHFARVKVPKILPRWVPLPGEHRFVPLELVIALHLESLFPGVEILGRYPFRISRNTDLEIDQDDDAEDLLNLIQEEVRNRRFAEIVRLEIHPAMPVTLRDLLLDEFNAEQEADGTLLTRDDIYEVAGLLDGSELMALSALDIPGLHDPAHAPVLPAPLAGSRNIFDVIRDGDVLVHHPYESFTGSVERFIQAAVDDPDVLAIKLTLYRIGADSAIARLLQLAAERGKQVAVLIELQARFDEESNIRWAKRLEDVGVHVSYGVAGLKTHSKVILVVRREGSAIRRYVHVGTGNYAARTARIYTDFGLFSAQPDLGADLSDLFNVLTGFAYPDRFRKILVAPTALRPWVLEAIRREAAHARAGRPARILARMNALVDAEVIQALYEASGAGVEIDLLVRGICCLRPGVPGVSDRIRVRSVIGRFLEHSRAVCFENGGRREVFIGSADWMPRNFDRRIEVIVPVEDSVHQESIRHTMAVMLEDNRQAWDLRADGTYSQCQPGEESERGTHRVLMDYYRERGVKAEVTGTFPVVRPEV
jgi:polyphosphate kinase